MKRISKCRKSNIQISLYMENLHFLHGSVHINLNKTLLGVEYFIRFAFVEFNLSAGWF